MNPSNAPRVRRLALLGGESSGKTTLARALAAELGTAWVAEYGRQRWEELRETLSVEELVHVAETQVAWELAAESDPAAMASGWLVCDTTPLTTLQYCLHDHGQAPAALWALAQRPYDLVVVCEPDFDFVQDGCRRDDAYRQAQHAWTLDRLRERGQPWVAVRGSVAERVASLRPYLQASAALRSEPGAWVPVAPDLPR
jgi:HTH-type transcriptional repressor of NAD biosynthesis genes